MKHVSEPLKNILVEMIRANPENAERIKAILDDLRRKLA